MHGIGVIRVPIVVVVFTEPSPGLIRFISLRKANQEEHKAYEEAVKDEMGPR